MGTSRRVLTRTLTNQRQPQLHTLSAGAVITGSTLRALRGGLFATGPTGRKVRLLGRRWLWPGECVGGSHAAARRRRRRENRGMMRINWPIAVLGILWWYMETSHFG